MLHTQFFNFQPNVNNSTEQLHHWHRHSTLPRNDIIHVGEDTRKVISSTHIPIPQSHDGAAPPFRVSSMSTTFYGSKLDAPSPQPQRSEELVYDSPSPPSGGRKRSSLSLSDSSSSSPSRSPLASVTSSPTRIDDVPPPSPKVSEGGKMSFRFLCAEPDEEVHFGNSAKNTNLGTFYPWSVMFGGEGEEEREEEEEIQMVSMLMSNPVQRNNTTDVINPSPTRSYVPAYSAPPIQHSPQQLQPQLKSQPLSPSQPQSHSLSHTHTSTQPQTWIIPEHITSSVPSPSQKNKVIMKSLNKVAGGGVAKQYHLKLILEDHYKEKEKKDKAKQLKRKTWTRMTIELFSKIWAWEQSHKGAIKQSDVERKWNVNRTTYYRWKLRQAADVFFQNQTQNM